MLIREAKAKYPFYIIIRTEESKIWQELWNELSPVAFPDQYNLQEKNSTPSKKTGNGHVTPLVF